MLCGADEAGRGPVLGPLVVAAVAVEDEEALRSIGVRDSKRLSPPQRERLYHEITEACSYEVISLSPRHIDEGRSRMSLNMIEADAFASVLRPYRSHSLFVDCADANEATFAEAIRSRLGGCGPLVCRHRADDLFPVVSAASIIAKVIRDRAILSIQDEVGEEIGSGYPSDPKTVAFLERWINDKGNPPPFARCSWETTRRMIGRAKNSRLTDW